MNIHMFQIVQNVWLDLIIPFFGLYTPLVLPADDEDSEVAGCEDGEELVEGGEAASCSNSNRISSPYQS